jgi:hypothetical protein
MRGRGNSAVLEALAAIGAAVTLVLLLMLAGCGSRGSSNINAVDQSTVQALAELDAATAPDGVDGDLFAMLKAELRDALLRRTSTPPSGADNAIADLVLFDAGTEEWTLEWSYRNVGDYDQSGTVNIADITPIAVHFGQTYDLATEPDCIQAVVDGSGNGAVDIADITPIAQNFGTAVAGYSVEVSLTEGAEWDEVNTVLQGAASGDERKSLEFVLDTPAERSLYRVRAYDAGQVPSVDPSNPVRFYTLDLTLELLTPAEGGDGSAEDPYIVAEAEPYELQATYGAEDVSADLGFATMPPAFIAFTAEVPRILTVDNVMAGDFYVVGLLGELAPIESGRLYFRVQGDLPP